MKKRILAFATLATLLCSTLSAQDLTGSWQGTLKAGAAELRAIFDISKSDSGGWKASMFSIDQQPDAIPVNSVTLDGSTLKMTVNAVRGTYEGKISADGNSITGTWTQGRPLPLELTRATKETAWVRDPSPHTIQFIAVEKDIKLEVLDWGGAGRPLVLLAGLGNNAHVFDRFVPKLTPTYHVYGITRRGFGASSKPDSGYSADRLADDVLAVIDSLKLTRPVLAGHSLAGEELSSIGSRHPEKVAGLIYLDAAYPYAFYDATRGDLTIDVNELQKKIAELVPGQGKEDPKQLVKDLLESALPAFERDLKEQQKNLELVPQAVGTNAPMPQPAPAVFAGMQKYTDIRGPILAIYALPHNLGPAATPELKAHDEVTTGAQAKAFETAFPSARVVRLPNASHFVFLSNEADVLREMNAFIAGLPN